jgi:hypothetical protein
LSDLLIASINRPADKFRRIAGRAQGFSDGKNSIENSLCGNQLRYLMAAIPVVSRDVDAFKAVS